MDDTSSYGPETATIKQMQGGAYSYAVHWYAGTGNWAASGVTVKVYDAHGLVATYTAPNSSSEPDATGKKWWYVFDLSGTTLAPKNALSANPPHTSSVTSLGIK